MARQKTGCRNREPWARRPRPSMTGWEDPAPGSGAPRPGGPRPGAGRLRGGRWRTPRCAYGGIPPPSPSRPPRRTRRWCACCAGRTSCSPRFWACSTPSSPWDWNSFAAVHRPGAPAFGAVPGSRPGAADRRPAGGQHPARWSLPSPPRLPGRLVFFAGDGPIPPAQQVVGWRRRNSRPGRTAWWPAHSLGHTRFLVMPVGRLTPGGRCRTGRTGPGGRRGPSDAASVQAGSASRSGNQASAGKARSSRVT